MFICELLDEDPEEPEAPRFITLEEKKGRNFCESLQKLLMIFCSIPREAVVEAAKALALMGLGWLLLIVGAEEAALLGI